MRNKCRTEAKNDAVTLGAEGIGTGICVRANSLISVGETLDFSRGSFVHSMSRLRSPEQAT